MYFSAGILGLYAFSLSYCLQQSSLSTEIKHWLVWETYVW